MTLFRALSSRVVCAAGGFLLLLASTNALAQPASAFGKLRSDDPNYIVYASSGDDDTLAEDAHVEFLLSLRYPLVEAWFARRHRRLDSHYTRYLPNRLLLVYNGLYDFYVFEGDRYESAPIVSRRQNPGLALEWDLRRNAMADNYRTLRLGWFHESNGQSLDDEDGDGAALFAREVAESDEEFALSQVSRGWDYLSLRFANGPANVTGGEVDPYREGWWKLQAELRIYCDCQGFGFISGREDDIFWKPVSEQPRIHDFDGLRVGYERAFSGERLGTDNYFVGRLQLQSGTGDWRALGTVSSRLSLGFALGDTRLLAFYHNGYGKDLSTYHIRTNYVGLGLELR